MHYHRTSMKYGTFQLLLKEQHPKHSIQKFCFPAQRPAGYMYWLWRKQVSLTDLEPTSDVLCFHGINCTTEANILGYKGADRLLKWWIRSQYFLLALKPQQDTKMLLKTNNVGSNPHTWFNSKSFQNNVRGTGHGACKRINKQAGSFWHAAPNQQAPFCAGHITTWPTDIPNEQCVRQLEVQAPFVSVLNTLKLHKSEGQFLTLVQGSPAHSKGLEPDGLYRPFNPTILWFYVL